jgi:hypothetical protein
VEAVMASNHQVRQEVLNPLKKGRGNIERCAAFEIATEVLWIVVPYTTPDFTRAALRHAGVCTDLDVHVCLVDIQVIPFPIPLDRPPINKEFSEERLHKLLRESGLPGKAAVVYTRDWVEGFRKVMEPGSLVILATKKRWWRTREEKLARTLMNAGHDVMLLPVVR